MLPAIVNDKEREIGENAIHAGKQQPRLDTPHTANDYVPSPSSPGLPGPFSGEDSAPLAQLDRASVYGTEGCRFDSCTVQL
jgi:hypothetical protein